MTQEQINQLAKNTRQKTNHMIRRECKKMRYSWNKLGEKK